jgi:hypothetical protein
MTCVDKVYALELVGVQNGDILEPKSRVEKNRIEKNRVENFSPIPSLNNILENEEIVERRGLDLLQEFINHWGEKNKR